MFSPLLKSVIAREGLAVVGQDTLDDLAADLEYAALFFAGDAARHAESDDVAIILPELVRAFRGAFTPLVVARDAERPLQRRYRFNAFPALVFLRRGGYLGVIQRVLDWQDYGAEIAAILRREQSDPPRFEFPEGCGAPAPGLAN